MSVILALGVRGWVLDAERVMGGGIAVLGVDHEVIGALAGVRGEGG